MANAYAGSMDTVPSPTEPETSALKESTYLGAASGKSTSVIPGASTTLPAARV